MSAFAWSCGWVRHWAELAPCAGTPPGCLGVNAELQPASWHPSCPPLGNSSPPISAAAHGLCCLAAGGGTGLCGVGRWGSPRLAAVPRSPHAHHANPFLPACSSIPACCAPLWAASAPPMAAVVPPPCQQLQCIGGLLLSLSPRCAMHTRWTTCPFIAMLEELCSGAPRCPPGLSLAQFSCALRVFSVCKHQTPVGRWAARGSKAVKKGGMKNSKNQTEKPRDPQCSLCSDVAASAPVMDAAVLKGLVLEMNQTKLCWFFFVCLLFFLFFLSLFLSFFLFSLLFFFLFVFKSLLPYFGAHPSHILPSLPQVPLPMGTRASGRCCSSCCPSLAAAGR